jgi:hypothetical protein
VRELLELTAFFCLLTMIAEQHKNSLELYEDDQVNHRLLVTYKKLLVAQLPVERRQDSLEEVLFLCVDVLLGGLVFLNLRGDQHSS